MWRRDERADEEEGSSSGWEEDEGGSAGGDGLPAAHSSEDDEDGDEDNEGGSDDDDDEDDDEDEPGGVPGGGGAGVDAGGGRGRRGDPPAEDDAELARRLQEQEDREHYRRLMELAGGGAQGIPPGGCYVRASNTPWSNEPEYMPHTRKLLSLAVALSGGMSSSSSRSKEALLLRKGTSSHARAMPARLAGAAPACLRLPEGAGVSMCWLGCRRLIYANMMDGVSTCWLGCRRHRRVRRGGGRGGLRDGGLGGPGQHDVRGSEPVLAPCCPCRGVMSCVTENLVDPDNMTYEVASLFWHTAAPVAASCSVLQGLQALVRLFDNTCYCCAAGRGQGRMLPLGACSLTGPQAAGPLY